MFFILTKNTMKTVCENKLNYFNYISLYIYITYISNKQCMKWITEKYLDYISIQKWYLDKHNNYSMVS